MVRLSCMVKETRGKLFTICIDREMTIRKRFMKSCLEREVCHRQKFNRTANRCQLALSAILPMALLSWSVAERSGNWMQCHFLCSTFDCLFHCSLALHRTSIPRVGKATKVRQLTRRVVDQSIGVPEWTPLISSTGRHLWCAQLTVPCHTCCHSHCQLQSCQPSPRRLVAYDTCKHATLIGLPVFFLVESPSCNCFIPTTTDIIDKLA